MAKRFIDTGMFDDPWFMDLSKDAKITWVYIITKCDHAGIIEINERLFKLQTGINSWSTVRKELDNRIYNLRDMYFFIPKFIQFQYPDFPKSNVNQQSGAIKRLIEFGLFKDGQLIDIQCLNSSSTLNEVLTKTYGNVNGNDSIGNGSGKVITWRDSFEIYLEECKQAYRKYYNDEQFILTQSKLNPNVNVKLSITKGFENFWGIEAGWKNKKKSRTNEIDWRQTIVNSIDINKVYYTKQELESTVGVQKQKMTY